MSYFWDAFEEKKHSESKGSCLLTAQISNLFASLLLFFSPSLSSLSHLLYITPTFLHALSSIYISASPPPQHTHTHLHPSVIPHHHLLHSLCLWWSSSKSHCSWSSPAGLHRSPAVCRSVCPCHCRTDVCLFICMGVISRDWWGRKGEGGEDKDNTPVLSLEFWSPVRIRLVSLLCFGVCLCNM